MRTSRRPSELVAAVLAAALLVAMVVAPGSLRGLSGGGDGNSGSPGFAEAPPAVAAAPDRAVPAGSELAEPERVREVPEGRSATTSVYQLADGRLQAEVSATPVNYRDSGGSWRRIDTRVRPVDSSSAAGRDGYRLANTTNTFDSLFGASTDQLAAFRFDGRSVSIGLSGAPRAVTPDAAGDTVRFADVVDGADLEYRVGPEALKERIVLSAPPEDASFRFTVELAGLVPSSGENGAIELSRRVGGPPVLVIPAPFMTDSAPDSDSPYGTAWSPDVTQSFTQTGSVLTVTVRADSEWLTDSARAYPVVIDPTIEVVPTPTQSQDVMISASEPDRNFNDTYRLDVGTTSSGADRSLVRFPLTNIPTGVPLDSAVLRMYFDQTFTSDAFNVPIEAHRATAPWSAETATWNTANDNVGELGMNQELVDDGDPGKTVQTGNWPYSTNEFLTPLAINHDYAFNKDDVPGESYTWIPRLTESGDYRVEAHYVTAGDRAVAAPYTITGSDGTTTATLDQTSGGTNVGVWGQLADSVPFTAGTTGRVRVDDVDDPNQSVLVDAVRLTKDGIATKGVNEWGMWHEFSVRNIVQSWLDGTETNNGFVLKVPDEDTLGQGGPRYEASEFAYNGEIHNRPTLVLTWGTPSVTLAPITVAHATGGELAWSAYPDPSPGAVTGDDIVEYQVHRSVFQVFTPQASTLVAPLSADIQSYTDTTATPTPADSAEPFGDAFYYMIAVKTRDGRLIPSTTQEVRLPKAGQVFRTIPAVADTTLSSGQPDSGHNVLDGHADVGVGNLSGSFGTLRTLVEYPDLSAIPPDAIVLDAQVRLWSYFTDPVNDVEYSLHQLGRDFDEASATWNQASSGQPWSTPGGDLGPAVSTEGNFTNDPAWRTWDATSLVHDWITNPTTPRAVGIRLANETSPIEESLLLSSEANEPALRPQLRVVYTEPNTESTYFAPATPDVIPLGAQRTVPVTVTNTTDSAWTPDGHVLSYTWALPDGTDVTSVDNRIETPLPQVIAPGDTVTINADLMPPDPPVGEESNKRIAYELTWQIEEKTTALLAGPPVVPGLKQHVTVDDPTSDQLGLEKFYQYSTMSTGAGSSLSDNLYAGNTVWGYNALTNPGRGLSTFVRMTYNSLDTSDSPMGFGWSLSTSSVMRAGSPLEFHPRGQSWPSEISLIDGDGTTHTFHLNKHGTTDEEQWDYDHPAGVHLYLRKTGDSDTSRAWVMTAPDRTRFFFDEDGYQSAVADPNGNELTFTYEHRRSQNKPTEFLQYLTDPAGRQSLTIDYYAKGDDYSFIDDAGNKVNDTNLTNPKIIDRVRSITDISGRRIEFTYTDKGLMAEMIDGAGDTEAKTFRFTYDALQGNKNVKLVAVTDPRGNATTMAYYSPPDDDPTFHWRLKTVTDRLGNDAHITYADPDGNTGETIQTTVTDAESHSSVYLMDGRGRPTQITNALTQTTRLRFDDDNNVDQLTEDNNATTTWTFDPNTGFPLSMTDAQANNDGTPGSVYEYRTSQNGHVADLVAKTSPEGRRWTFGYDALGNLLSVTDPAGTATPAEDDFTTTYTYNALGELLTATDANGNPTTFDDYDPNGYPQTITDALDEATTFAYDERGQVTTVTDALGHHTTQDYDIFGRPLAQTIPKDEANGDFITTPAPVYDPNDNVTTSTAPNGAVSTFEYDAADQVTSISAPKDTPTSPNRTAAYTYDKVGNRLTQTAPNGTLTTEDPSDYVTHFTYDDIYQLTSLTNADGATITYGYDTVGNMTSEIDADRNASADPDDFTAKYMYDLNHRATTVTDAAGNTKSTDYDRDGNVVARTDEDGNTALVTLDERAMVSQVEEPFTTDAGSTIYHTTRYTYDQNGNQVTVETPRGVATPIAGDFTATTTYDELSRVKDQFTPFDPNDPRYNTADRTTYSYDAVGRVSKVSAPPSAGQSVRNDSTYTYFDNGWTRTSTDSWDITTSYDYNNLGQQKSRTLTSAGGSSARTMTWDHYPDGKLKSRTDSGVPVGSHVVLVDNTDAQNVSAIGTWPAATAASGFQGFNYQTHTAGTGSDSFTWNLTIPQDGDYEVFVKYPHANATNAPYSITDSAGTTSTVSVNQTSGDGNWVSLGSHPFTTDASGQKVVLTDQANGTVAADAVKLVRDNSADVDNERIEFSYSYDPNGNQTQVTDSSPNALIDTYAITYDGLDQVASVEEMADGVVKHTTGFDYDPNGNAIQHTHDDAVATFEYDIRNLLSKVTNADSSSDPNPQTSTYTYNATGELESEVKPNGNTVSSSYFLDGSLRHQVEHKSDGVSIVAEHTFDYDPNGNQISDISHVQNADDHAAYVDRTTNSTYDPRDRVATHTKTDGSGSPVSDESYVYDANGNTISQTVGGTTTTSAYDRNRLQTQVTGGASSGYNYDPYGRLDTVTADGQVAVRYTYDGFDHIARETQQTGNGQVTTAFTYDPFDRTASQTVNPGGSGEKTTVFGYLAISEALVTETVNGTLTKSYEYSPWGERIAQIIHKSDGTEEPTYYTYNGHSDVDAVTDENGDTKSTYGYTAYGAPDESQETGADADPNAQPGDEPYNSYRFAAARLDTSTGNYDMGFRDYAPGLNRFLTRDLFTGALSDMRLSTNPFTNNRYTFAGGNPITGVDLDGHFGLPFSNIVHAALDVAGMVPVIGAGADALNGALYLAEGDYLNAGLSFVGVIPVLGEAATGSRFAIRGARRGGKFLHSAENAGSGISRLSRARSVTKAADTVDSEAATGLRAVTHNGQDLQAGVTGYERGSTTIAGVTHGGQDLQAGAVRTTKPSTSCLNSFPGSTLVLLGNGTTTRIDQVQVGDWVEATDPDTGQTISEPVTAIHVTTIDHDYTDITIRTADGHTATITSTAHHRYYTTNRHTWVDATNLHTGDQLRQPNGTPVTITTVTDHPGTTTTTYNLTITNLHTYYTLAGTTPILVHNCGSASDDLAAMRSDLQLPAAGAPNDASTLARLDVNGQRFYGINGHGQSYPRPPGVTFQTMRHAEADAFGQAGRAGVRGGSGTLYVDRAPCGFCRGGLAGLARSLDLDDLTVIARGGMFGRYTRGGGFALS